MLAIPNMEMPKSCYMCDYKDSCKVKPKVEWERWQKVTDGCPLIDIVTCGECKWSYTDERDGTLWCKVHMSHYRVNSDGFCNYGERALSHC